LNSPKYTLVIGASENEERYSNKAIKMLTQHNIPHVAIGIKEGKVAETTIATGQPKFEDLDTITLYVGPKNQPEYFDYILSLEPKRVIFNPGTENEAFYELLDNNNIEVMEACTLVLLTTHQY
jgi:uncharacterized protein